MNIESAEFNEPRYTTRAVCELTGVNYRRVDFWCRSGYVGTRLRDQHVGYGRRRLFTPNELYTLRHLATLVDIGLEPRTAWELLLNKMERLVDGSFRVKVNDKVAIYWTLDRIDS